MSRQYTIDELIYWGILTGSVNSTDTKTMNPLWKRACVKKIELLEKDIAALSQDGPAASKTRELIKMLTRYVDRQAGQEISELHCPDRPEFLTIRYIYQTPPPHGSRRLWMSVEVDAEKFLESLKAKEQDSPRTVESYATLRGLKVKISDDQNLLAALLESEKLRGDSSTRIVQISEDHPWPGELGQLVHSLVRLVNTTTTNPVSSQILLEFDPSAKKLLVQLFRAATVLNLAAQGTSRGTESAA